jgi:hypothetical protein
MPRFCPLGMLLLLIVTFVNVPPTSLVNAMIPVWQFVTVLPEIITSLN